MFKRTTITCDDLLQADAIKLADLVEKEVNTAMPPATTGLTKAVRELVAFDKLALYS